MTKTKICGITNLADARYASGAGADFLGFIQHEASARFVMPEMAKEIINWLYGAKTVGVFVDVSPDDVNSAVETAGFDYVQLHGNETAAYCEWIDSPIIKALKVEPTWTSETVEEIAKPFVGLAEFLLLDTFSPDVAGGSGIAFDWTILENCDPGIPIILAGGLQAENVGEAIKTVQPYGVDVASGVESAPGEKDFERIDRFMEAVRSV